MISKLSGDMVNQFMTPIMTRLIWVSLHEYAPQNFGCEAECKSPNYRRQEVIWRPLGNGSIINANHQEFMGLELPLVVQAVGLHMSRNDQKVWAWGMLTPNLRATGSNVIIRAGSLSVRIG